MKPQVTKESLALWIAELESQPHLSLKEERYLAVMKRCLIHECADDSVQVQGLIAAIDNESLISQRWEKRARVLGWVDYE